MIKRLIHKNKDTYVLLLTYSILTPFKINKIITSKDKKVTLYKIGVLRIKRGFIWDGMTFIGEGTILTHRPSGWPLIHPIKDKIRSWARASLCHDALYTILEKLYDAGVTRKAIDKWFYQLLLEDGCPKVHAKVMYIFVRLLGRCFHVAER
jgi:hypothetical protein